MSSTSTRSKGKGNPKKISGKSDKKEDPNSSIVEQKDNDVCLICKIKVDEGDKGVECDICKNWFHKRCQRVSDGLYDILNSEEGKHVSWYCDHCQVGAQSIMSHILVLNQRQDKLEKRMKSNEDKHVSLEKRVSELESTAGNVNSLEDTVKELKQEVENQETRTPQPEELAEREKGIVSTVCSNVQDRISRQTNIIIYNAPEGNKVLREENRMHDQNQVKEIYKIVTGQNQPELMVKRLGKKMASSGEDIKSRPLLVTLPSKEEKANFMKNLGKLKNSEQPYNSLTIKHDMNREDREQEKQLQREAKDMSLADSQSKEVYLVRGLPGERRIIKVKKKEKRLELREEEPGSETEEEEKIQEEEIGNTNASQEPAEGGEGVKDE